jgi:hypothetical protein
MDTYLLNIIKAAEAKAPVPAVNLVTNGGDWIRGIPCSSERFRELTWAPFIREIEHALNNRPRQERKANPVAPSDVATPAFQAIGEAKDAPGDPVLNLAQAFLSFGGRSDGLQLAAIRVPTRAISSWWVAGASYVKPESKPSLFGGVFFPIGN